MPPGVRRPMSHSPMKSFSSYVAFVSFSGLPPAYRDSRRFPNPRKRVVVHRGLRGVA